jgi:hypothetical protein
MNKTVVLLTCALAVFLFVGFVAAEETQHARGKVVVTKAEGKVTAIALETGEGATKGKVAVELDEKGLKLAELDGKVVFVKGKITEKEGAKTVKVEEFKMHEPKPAGGATHEGKPAGDKPAGEKPAGHGDKPAPKHE